MRRHQTIFATGFPYLSVSPYSIRPSHLRQTGSAVAEVMCHNEWKINHLGAHHGPCETQQDAICAAVDAAHEAGKLGFDAQVLVQGKNSQFRTEWTYGNDPYPPPG